MMAMTTNNSIRVKATTGGQRPRLKSGFFFLIAVQLTLFSAKFDAAFSVVGYNV